MMLVVSPLLTLVAVVIVPPSIGLSKLIARRARPRFVDQWRATGDLNGQAEEVFRQDLTRNPGNGRSLYGLWQSLLLQKKESAAAAEKTFRSAWKNADVQLDLRHE